MNQNLDLFNTVANKYADKTYWRPDEETVLKFFVPGTMLVGGVGAGRVVPHLSKWKLTCVDISPAMVEECKKKGIDAEVMDIQRTTFPDASFDNIFLPFHTICYVDSVPETLKELRRILKPGGVLVISAVNRFFIRDPIFWFRRSQTKISSQWKLPIHVHQFSLWDRCEPFTQVMAFGRMQLAAIDDANWKDRVLKMIPFMDKSLYFICS